MALHKLWLRVVLSNVLLGAMLLVLSPWPDAASGQATDQADTDTAATETNSSDAAVKEFVTAAARGDQEAIDQALAAGMDINARTPAGSTAWHVARRRGYEELADYLVTQGADASIPMPRPEVLAEASLGRGFTNNSPALVALVARDGKILFERAFGNADVDGHAPAALETKFLIGSVTKQFTAAAILKLQEMGQLSVDDKLSNYYPDFPRADEVTLHHLLTHTSGMHSYTSEPDFGARVGSAIDVDDLIGEIHEYEFEFDPGEKWEYSNSGYLILGRIVEKVSGQSYGEFLQQWFFDPLGMKDTGVYDNGNAYTNQAKGYSFVDEELQPAKPWHMSWAGGAGQLYSTLHDLMRWNEGVFGGQVLNEASRQAAFTPATLNDGSQTEYGYGWMISDMRGLKVITHSGGLDGFASHLARYPDQNVTVVAMCNCVPGGAEAGAFQAGGVLAELFLWQEMQPRKAPEIDESIDTEKLAKYVGRYDYGRAVMELTLKDGQFYGQLTGQPAIKLFPQSETVLVAKIVEASIEFVSDDDGNVTHVIHRQGSQTIEAPRMEDVDFIELSPAELDKFVGKYDYGPAGKLTIKRQGDTLVAQLTGQPALRMRPTSPTEFAWVAANARIEFELDENGHVTGGTHHQGGQQLAVKRMDRVARIACAPWSAAIHRRFGLRRSRYRKSSFSGGDASIFPNDSDRLEGGSAASESGDESPHSKENGHGTDASRLPARTYPSISVEVSACYASAVESASFCRFLSGFPDSLC